MSFKLFALEDLLGMTCSRWLAKFMCLGFLYFGLCGCGLKWGEGAPVQPKLSLGVKGELQCFDNFGLRLSAIGAQPAASAETLQLFDCVGRAAKAFEELTTGEHPDRYSAGEVSAFLNRYVFNKKPLKPELLTSLFQIKVALFGGTVEGISRADLKAFQEKIVFLKGWLPSAHPHIFTLRNQGSNLTEPKALENHLKESLNHSQKLIAGLQLQTDMPWSWAEDLVQRLAEYNELESWWRAPSPTRRWFELISRFKSLTLGSNSESLNRSEALPLIHQAILWHAEVLRYQLFVKSKSVFAGQGLEQLEDFGTNLLHLASGVVAQRATRLVPYGEIDELIVALGDLHLLPFGLRAETVVKLLRPLTEKVFQDPVGDSRSRGQGVTRSTLDQMTLEFNRWVDLQNQLAPLQRLQNQKAPQGDLVAKIFPSLEPSEPVLDLAWIKSTIRPLFQYRENHVFLVEAADMPRYGIDHNFYNQSIMNVVRAILQLAVRGYSLKNLDVSGSELGLQEAELQEVYEDLRQLGIDLEVFDPRVKDSGKRAWKEAQLFVYSADGVSLPGGDSQLKPERMSFSQGLELLSYLYSGGILSTEVYSDLANKCAHGPRGIHDVLTLQRSCVEQQIVKVLVAHIKSMPGLKSHLEGILSDHDLLELGGIILRSAYVEGHSHPQWVDKTELGVAMMVIHYTETVMTRFNTNLDAYLDEREADAGFKVFEGFIGRLARQRCLTDDSYNLSIYRHILATGTIPERNNWTGAQFYIRNLLWGSDYSPLRFFKADRTDLLKIFTTIISVMSQERRQAPMVCEVSGSG